MRKFLPVFWPDIHTAIDFFFQESVKLFHFNNKDNVTQNGLEFKKVIPREKLLFKAGVKFEYNANDSGYFEIC